MNGIRLFVGGHAGTIQGEREDLAGDRCFTAAHRPQAALLNPLELTGLLDSGAFSDPWERRLSFEQALARQVKWEQKAIKTWQRQWQRHLRDLAMCFWQNEELVKQIVEWEQLISHAWERWQSYAFVSYDLLIDEVWVAGKRQKQRWSVADANSAVQATIEAAAYLATQRERLDPRKLILSCQGVDSIQYLECVQEVLKVATPSDWIGLGGWCILGRQKSWMPEFWATLHAILPIISAANIKHVHLFGVLYLPALGGLLWLADHYGLTVSTDSTRPVLEATWADQKKSGARFAYWRENVAWWKCTLSNLRSSEYYREPPRLVVWQATNLLSDGKNMARKTTSKQHKVRTLDPEIVALRYERVQQFVPGTYVNKPNKTALGQVKEIGTAISGLPEIWVSWDGATENSELMIEDLFIDEAAEARAIASGQLIAIAPTHQTCSNQIFVADRQQARGTVITTDNQVFTQEYWELLQVGDRVSVTAWNGRQGVVTLLKPLTLTGLANMPVALTAEDIQAGIQKICGLNQVSDTSLSEVIDESSLSALPEEVRIAHSQILQQEMPYSEEQDCILVAEAAGEEISASSTASTEQKPTTDADKVTIAKSASSSEFFALSLSEIATDGGTQSRLKLNDAVIKDYAEAMAAGVQFPPLIVFYDGTTYWLADGFHRYYAAKIAEISDIFVDVKQGTRRDAVLFSVGANATHGLRRTNDDKRRAVETLLLDQEWNTWSDREIAKRCSVGNKFVGDLRRSLCSEHSERTYTTKHGTTAVMQTTKIGKSSASETELTARPPLQTGARVLLKPTHHLAGSIGTITSLPNAETAIVEIEGRNERLTISRHHLQLLQEPVSQDDVVSPTPDRKMRSISPEQNQDVPEPTQQIYQDSCAGAENFERNLPSLRSLQSPDLSQLSGTAIANCNQSIPTSNPYLIFTESAIGVLSNIEYGTDDQFEALLSAIYAEQQRRGINKLRA